jgi:hypothetical protein
MEAISSPEHTIISPVPVDDSHLKVYILEQPFVTYRETLLSHPFIMSSKYDILKSPPKALTFDVFGTVGAYAQSTSSF